MKNSRYIIIMLVAALLVSVTGCSKKVQEPAKGKYVEKEMTLPTQCLEKAESIWSSAVNMQGELEIAAQDENGCITVYRQVDNETWEEKGKISDWEKEEMKEILSCGIKEDGICFFYTNEQDELFVYEKDFEGNEKSCGLTDESGTCKMLPNSYYKLEKSESGDYIVQSAWDGPVRSYDGETGKYKNTFSEIALSFSLSGSQVIINNGWENPTVVTYDIETGNEVKNISYDIQSDSNMVCNNSKGIYILNSSGITFNNGSGTTWEKIVEPEGTILGGTQRQIDKVFAMEDGSIIVSIWVDQGIELIKYYFDPEAKNTYENEVTIYMAYDLDLIKAAASLYSRKHPEIKVNIQTWTNDMGYGEQIEQLNTEILAGEGPDMILLDQLPAQKYIDKGVLLDLADIAQSYIDEKQGYSNIVNAFKQEGKVYAIPLRYRVPMLLGKAEVIDNGASLEDLASYKQEHAGEILMNKNLYELALQMSEISEPYLSDSEGKYDREKMISYLQMLKRIGEEKELSDEEQIQERIDFEPAKYQEMMDVVEGKSAVCIIEPRNFQDMVRCDAILDANKECIVAPMMKDEKVIYHTLGNMAINANSKNIDIVKEIIKIALSDEIQGEVSWMGFAPSVKDNELQRKNGGGYQEEIVDQKGRTLSIDDQIEKTYDICEQSWEEASLSANRIGDVPDMGTSMAYRLQNKEKSLDELLDDLEEKIKIRQGQ